MQLPRCARGLASTQPRSCPFPVTSLQRAIKTSRAACRGSANSLAQQDPSQEEPAKLQEVVVATLQEAVAAAAAAAAEAKGKCPAAHGAPECQPYTQNFYGSHCEGHPLSPKSSRSTERCLPRCRQAGGIRVVSSSRCRKAGSPASRNRDPQNCFPISSPAQKVRCLQIAELKCLLKLESGGIPCQQGQPDSSPEAFLSTAPRVLLARKEPAAFPSGSGFSRTLSPGAGLRTPLPRGCVYGEDSLTTQPRDG